MRFGDDDPWFSLVESWVPVDEVARMWNGDRWDDSDEWIAFFESVLPGDVVDPLLVIFIELVSVVLAWEAVIVRIDSFNNPPLSFDI